MLDGGFDKSGNLLDDKFEDSLGKLPKMHLLTVSRSKKLDYSSIWWNGMSSAIGNTLALGCMKAYNLDPTAGKYKKIR